MGKQDIDIKISLSLVGLVLIAASFLLNAHAFADDVVDQINITVPESCTVEPLVSYEHTKTVQNNQYYSGIGTTTFKTYCNDNNGYAIYAVGYSNDEIGNTLMKHNSSSSYDFNTGTATSGDTSNWAMQLSAISGTYAPTIHSDTNGTFSSYHVVPSEYTKVVSFASNTDLPATGVNADGSGFTSTYAAWISATQPAGTYIGKVLYQLVHPMTEVPLQPVDCPSGYICYNPNGGNVVGTMGQQSVSASDTSIMLLAGNYSRSGYGFAGWSDAYDYTTNSNARFYGPQEDISFTAGQYTGTNDGLALYAVWVKSAGSIQDTNKVATLCGTGTGSLTTAPANGTANLNSVSALTDQRDNITYAIAKLADGNCWMIENLRLESTAEHNTDGALAQGYGSSSTYGNFRGLADAETDNFWYSTTANSLYYSGTQSGTASINIGTTNYPHYRMPRYNNTNTFARALNPTANGSTVAFYSFGNYYTWHAAIADTTYYDNSDSGTELYDHSITSICPSGWRLPRGAMSTANKSFGALSVALGGPANGAASNSSSVPTGSVMSKRFRGYPNNFLYSGYFDLSDATYRGTSGFYWSSTPSTNENSYRFRLTNTYVYPGTAVDSKYFGFSIRCIANS